MQERIPTPIDLTKVLDPETGKWHVDDGADTDGGDPLAKLCPGREQSEATREAAREKLRYRLGTHYNVAVSLKSWFRKRSAQEDDFNFEQAELIAVREKCSQMHEHRDACFQTLHMRFLQSKSEKWVDPAKNRCVEIC